MTFDGPSRGAASWAGRRLRLASGVIFTGLLVWAPLNFGSTRSGGPELLTAGCAAATLLWFGSLACGGPRAQVPCGAAVCLTWLTLAALPWITGLASLTPLASFTQAHFAQVAARWPSSIVWRTPANMPGFTLALAAAALPLIDLAHSRAWALTFSLALTATAVAIGGLALLQNFTHATGIYWRNDGRLPGNFCGTFYHHTAAGAYFNTAWPLAAALTLLAWHRLPASSARPALVAAGILGTLILLAAQGSHVSRFPQVAGLLVAPFLLRRLELGSQRRWLLAAGAVAAVGLLIAVAGRPTEIAERWRLMFASGPAASTPSALAESAWPRLMRDDLFVPHASPVGWLGDRGESWRTALRSIAERPLMGHGPGNWMGAASHHTVDPFVRTFFQFLQFTHQDLLQFAVEWGVPATLGWWGFLIGAVIVVSRARRWATAQHHEIALAAACGLGAVLLQSQVDFPLQMPAILFNVVVLAALCWASGQPLPPPRIAAPAAA